MISDGEKIAPPGGLEPPTFRLTAERASQLRHGGFTQKCNQIYITTNKGTIYDCTHSRRVMFVLFRYGLVVRIPGSHPGGPGSIPGNGSFGQLLKKVTE